MKTQIDTNRGILLITVLIFLGFIVFFKALYYHSQDTDKNIPTLKTNHVTRALRGNILSADGYILATSHKLYKAMVRTKYIDKDKKDMFAKLYSIFSGTDLQKTEEILSRGKSITTLSYDIDEKTAKQLKRLGRELDRLKVFLPYKDPKTRKSYRSTIDIVEYEEKRIYPRGDILTPYIGYISKEYNKLENFHIIKGMKGVEGFYEDRLMAIQNAIIYGTKDIGKYVILNHDSNVKKRIDGLNVTLSVSLKLQKSLENILDKQKKLVGAKEIVAVIMKSDTGELLAIGSSNRYNPNNISQKDYKNLNPTALEYAYEPGSVMKPITLSLLLREDKVDPLEIVNTHNGKYKYGKFTILDDHPYKQLSAEDIIVHSSNIGILKLSQRLTPLEFHEGLKDFGFAQKNMIDLKSYEQEGNIPSIQSFETDMYKRTSSYGYGLQANFMQILKAYNVFNNGGNLISPYIGAYLTDGLNRKIPLSKSPETKILPSSVVNKMKQILIKTVQEGTGKGARIDGLEIGGKTGTAKISMNGGYKKIYNGSFFGFANDSKNRFTIGVLATQLKHKYYYGSQNSVPVFKEIVKLLVDEKYLAPKLDQNISKK